MIKRILVIVFLSINLNIGYAQRVKPFADSIRTAYHIPELGYAVVSSTQIDEIDVAGFKQINTLLFAGANDKFRIGSNTKAITGFIAALLVKQHKISWDTRFFDLYPELKAGSNPAYHNLTLLDLLTFRTRLFPYTYTYAEPAKELFSGNEAAQRYQFAAWFLGHQPVGDDNRIHFSNLGYVAAGLMLEKASGKQYKELVTDLGRQLGITFGFGAPNSTDTLQPWGHNASLKPEAPGDNHKLNWLLAAGNINMSLPDYAKFIQLQLQGLAGQSQLLTKEEFEFLHYGLPTFAVGWFWNVDEHYGTYSYNTGNPGTFLTKVYVYKDAGKALILFSNAQTEDADTGLDALGEHLRRQYLHNINAKK